MNWGSLGPAAYTEPEGLGIDNSNSNNCKAENL